MLHLGWYGEKETEEICTFTIICIFLENAYFENNTVTCFRTNRQNEPIYYSFFCMHFLNSDEKLNLFPKWCSDNMLFLSLFKQCVLLCCPFEMQI